MVKAWLIVFMFWHSPNEYSLEEEKFAGKIEIPYASMTACVKATSNLTMESEDIRYEYTCVTDDHHSGRKVDQNVPLD
jgi:hypothetical protein